MAENITVLEEQEKKWLAARRVSRLTDDKEALIYPMGAERYLASVLSGHTQGRYNLSTDIEGKNVLVIPGYGNSAFLFAEAGAKSVTVYDKDPVTIAWIKAFKKYYHYREADLYPSIGELLKALTCWYPPLITLPTGGIKNKLYWVINPQQLRRSYLFYMLFLVQKALQLPNGDDFELKKDIKCYAGEVSQLTKNKKKQVFDTAFVPYLLGVENGIESTSAVVDFMQQMLQLVPKGHVLVSPTRNTKEFYFTGRRYFVTTEYATIQAIPELNAYFKEEDQYWFKTQGLAVFANPN